MENAIKAMVIFAIACLIFALFFGLPVMWLWNTCLVGAVDGIHTIDFPRALGIAVLIGLLTYRPAQTNNE